MRKPRTVRETHEAIARLSAELEALELTRPQLDSLLAELEELMLGIAVVRHSLRDRRVALMRAPRPTDWPTVD